MAISRARSRISISPSSSTRPMRRPGPIGARPGGCSAISIRRLPTRTRRSNSIQQMRLDTSPEATRFDTRDNSGLQSPSMTRPSKSANTTSQRWLERGSHTKKWATLPPPAAISEGRRSRPSNFAPTSIGKLWRPQGRGLPALNSGAAQPIIPPVPAKAASLTSLPTAPQESHPNLSCGATLAGRRVALVIGNANYWNANALNNPVQDALAVSRAFRALGFSVVTLGSDVTRSQMTDLLKEFAIQAGDSDWAVVYYSGHGVERNGVNYLIPVDAKIDEDSDSRLPQPSWTTLCPPSTAPRSSS